MLVQTIWAPYRYADDPCQVFRVFVTMILICACRYFSQSGALQLVLVQESTICTAREPCDYHVIHVTTIHFPSGDESVTGSFLCLTQENHPILIGWSVQRHPALIWKIYCVVNGDLQQDLVDLCVVTIDPAAVPWMPVVFIMMRWCDVTPHCEVQQ
jgi:hypothetical protein